jgi:hypothetical protein
MRAVGTWRGSGRLPSGLVVRRAVRGSDCGSSRVARSRSVGCPPGMTSRQDRMARFGVDCGVVVTSTSRPVPGAGPRSPVGRPARTAGLGPSNAACASRPSHARGESQNTVGYAVVAVRTNPGHYFVDDHPHRDAACLDNDPKMRCYRSPVRCPSRGQTRWLGG